MKHQHVAIEATAFVALSSKKMSLEAVIIYGYLKASCDYKTGGEVIIDTAALGSLFNKAPGSLDRAVDCLRRWKWVTGNGKRVILNPITDYIPEDHAK